MKTQFGHSVHILRRDNAQEYLFAPFNSFMVLCGLIHQSTCLHTPQQNGIAERKHQHIIETACTMLLHENALLNFLGDAVFTAD